MNLVVDIRLHISKREENVPENILLHTRFNPFTMDISNVRSRIYYSVRALVVEVV